MMKSYKIIALAALCLTGCDAFMEGFTGAHESALKIESTESLSDVEACLKLAQIADESGNIIYVPNIPSDAIRSCEAAHTDALDDMRIAIAFARALSQDENRHDEIEAIISKFEPDESGQIDYVRSIIYLRGDGVEQSDSEALRLAKLSAEKGYAPAMDEVGNRLERTAETDAEKAEAFKWWTMAADAGSSQGQYSVTDSYLYGYGVDKNESRAREYAKLSAEQGNFRGQNYYGYILEQGKGGDKNEAEALRYYELAAKQGYAIAQSNMGVTYYFGNLGVNENNEKARIWFEKAALQNNRRAYYYLGKIYENGYDVTPDAVLALHYYRKSASLKQPDAFEALGLMAKEGTGMAQNYELAMDYFKRGLDFECFNCLPNIGFLYERGEGVEQDWGKAVEHYVQSAKDENGWSADKLGQLYLAGRGVEKDVDLAITYFLQAVEINDRESSAKSIDTFILENENWRELVSSETAGKLDNPRATWRKLSR